MKNIQKQLFFTVEQKVIKFLSANADKEYTEKEIGDLTETKKSAVNLALRSLSEEGIVKKRKVGRTSLYSAGTDNMVIKELKVLQNILLIYPLIEKLKPEGQRVILFGSAARGTNTPESDIDLFVEGNDIDKIRKIVNGSEFGDKIQLIAKTPKEMLEINEQKPLFFQEIEKGKIIWENHGKQ
ncbi:MAG: nucleotidyltransferase domain-containing protein [Candidatus Paceibacterota bacterium]